MAHPRWRLVNGTTPAEGRLEHQLDNGTWVCLCTRRYQSYNSRREDLCSLLGFQNVMAFYEFSSSLLFGRCFRPVYCVKSHSNGSISVIPSTECRDNCDESGTTGLRCINSKFISIG